MAYSRVIKLTGKGLKAAQVFQTRREEVGRLVAEAHSAHIRFLAGLNAELQAGQIEVHNAVAEETGLSVEELGPGILISELSNHTLDAFVVWPEEASFTEGGANALN